MDKCLDYSCVELEKREVNEIQKWSHKWVIESFDKTIAEIFSKPFESAFDTKWQICVTSRQLSNGKPSFGLYVQNINHKTPNDRQSMAKSVKCYVYVIDIFGKEMQIGSKQICLENKITKLFEYEFDSIFDPKFGFICLTAKLSLVLKFVVRGQKCESLDDTNESLVLNVDSFIPVSESNPRRKALKSNSRITFIINDTKFSVDKTLVSLNSALFAQLFADNKHLDSFRLTDIRGQVFEDILHFINTGTVHNLEENRIDLLIAANKYRFKGLEVLCLNSIAENLSVDNVIKYLKTAKANQIESLMKKAFIFIDKNYNELIQTKDWNKNFKFVLKIGQSFVSKV